MSGSETGKAPGRSRFWLRAAVVACVLTGQNLLFFSLHYFAGWTIPWDFLGPYHAVPHYWIEAAQLGVSPLWVPFQAMGYPLYLNLQSGLYYPPFWWFVLTGSSYTVEAALVMQGLHVLFGAVGAVLCVRLLRMRWALALLAGVMYQAFGGFYSHASHPDIVRAYALLPWLCAPLFAPWDRTPLLRASIALVPLCVCGLWTGGYSGGALAVLFVTGSLLVARLVARRGDRDALRSGIELGLAMLAGTLLAGISLVPAFLDRHEITRTAARGFVTYDYLEWKDVLALVWRTETSFFGHDITMRTLFIGVPALVLVLLRLNMGRLRQAGLPLAMALLALAMASGAVHRPVMDLLPPLGYSRYILADYRAMMALPLILMGVQALHLASEGVTLPRRWRHGWLVVAAVLGIGAVLVMQGQRLPTRQDIETGAFLLNNLSLAVALVAGLLWLSKRPGRSTAVLWLVAGLAAVTLVDWARVHWHASFFHSENAKVWLESHTGPLPQARLALRERLTTPPACRPARLNVTPAQTDKPAWLGYYTGQYMAQDSTGPTHLARFQRIVQTPPLQKFGLEPWTALVLAPGTNTTAAAMTQAQPAALKCVAYGTTRIEYDVDLAQPTRVVENEVFWPGWTARINGVKISSFDAHDFRAWALPAGRYRMVATFETPHRNKGLATSLLGLLAWCALLALLLKRKQA